MAGLVPIRGRWLVGVRALWAVLAIAVVTLFLIAVPGRYDAIASRSGALVAALGRFGVPVSTYAGASIAIDGAYVLVSVGIAWLLLSRSPRVPMALFVAIFLVSFAGATSSTVAALRPHRSMDLVITIFGAIGYVGLNGLFYLFPDGHFVPRWTWALLAFAVVGQVPFSLPETSPYNPNSWPGPILLPLLLAIFGSLIFAQVYRYRRVSGPVERQQTKWLVCGGTTAIILMFVARLPGLASALFGHDGALLMRDPLMSLGFVLIPVAIGIAALRYRLWDIDVIINRTLVNAGMTAAVVSLYIVIVGYFGSVLQIGHSLPVSLIATGVVALLFHPLRQWLQRRVNRLMYGNRDDPYAVLSRLGAQLEAMLAPDATLPTIVASIAEALKVPYVAITLASGVNSTRSVATGTPAAHTLALPLMYGAEPIGQLIVAPRPGETSFSSADRRLLTDLARQAGVAAYAVRLTEDLQRARKRLVTTREEERRRLRRDLHDGLGPALGALSLQIGAARNLLPTDPARADAVLAGLVDDVAAAVGDIRRLVYDLRPPALDDLGLAGAIRALAAQFGGEGDRPIAIQVAATEPFSALPAATEVAAFRIVQEALTNVARHAEAQTCHIRVSPHATALHVEITDDGIGLPRAIRAGVGIVSMRERAVELGGSCQIETMAMGGTRVAAELPYAAGTES